MVRGVANGQWPSQHSAYPKTQPRRPAVFG